MASRIRTAQIKDLGQLLEIYNYEVRNGTATLDLTPRTMEEWEQWFYSHNMDNHPLLVAEEDGKIAGYACLSSYRRKEAFCSTVELSIYVHADFRRRGIAAKLMGAILELARQDERTHLVVSVLTAGNEASERLHERFGFQYCGRICEVGKKFGRYLDIDNYSLKVS